MSSPEGGSTSTQWDNLPNGDVAAAFAFLYAIMTMVVLVLTVKTRTYFMTLVCAAGFFETAGFATRVVFANSPNKDWRTAAEFFIVTAPSFLIATESYCVTRLARRTWIGAGSFLAGWGAFFFALSTCLTAVLKGTGAVLLSAAAYGTAANRVGQEVLISGVTLQLLFFSLLTVMTIYSHLDPNFGLLGNVALRPLLFALYTKIVFLFVRNIFRLVEFVQGPKGFIAQNEALLYAFDVVPVFACFILYCLFHYGWYLAPKRESSQDAALDMTKQVQARDTIHISASTGPLVQMRADQKGLYSPREDVSSPVYVHHHNLNPPYGPAPPPTRAQNVPSAVYLSQPQYTPKLHHRQPMYAEPPAPAPERFASPPRYSERLPAPARFTDNVPVVPSYPELAQHYRRSPRGSYGHTDYSTRPPSKHYDEYPEDAESMQHLHQDRQVTPPPPAYPDYQVTSPPRGYIERVASPPHRYTENVTSPPSRGYSGDHSVPTHYSDYVHSIHSYAERAPSPHMPHHRTQSPHRSQSPSQRAPSPSRPLEYTTPVPYQTPSPQHQHEYSQPPSTYRASSPNHTPEYGPPASYRAASPSRQPDYGSAAVPYRAPSPNRQPEYVVLSPPQSRPLSRHPSPRQSHTGHQSVHLPPQYGQPSPRQAHNYYPSSQASKEYTLAPPPQASGYAPPTPTPEHINLPISYCYEQSSDMDSPPVRKRSSGTDYNFYSEPPTGAVPTKPVQKTKVQA